MARPPSMDESFLITRLDGKMNMAKTAYALLGFSMGCAVEFMQHSTWRRRGHSLSS